MTADTIPAGDYRIALERIKKLEHDNRSLLRQRDEARRQVLSLEVEAQAQAERYTFASGSVHNHGSEEGLGLRCPERVINGRRVGACLVPEMAKNARIEQLEAALRDSMNTYPILKRRIEELEQMLRIACDWLDSYEVEGVPKLRAVLASENAEEFTSTYSDPAVRKAVNETVQQALAPEDGAERKGK